MLAKEGIDVAVINARFIKPLDDELIAKYCRPFAKIITVEEGSLAGGFGAAVMERVQQLGIRDVDFHRIGIPDEYVHHGAQDVLRAQYDLDAKGIAKRVREFVGEAKRMTLGTRWCTILEESAAAQIPGRCLEDGCATEAYDSDHIDEVVYGVRTTRREVMPAVLRRHVVLHRASSTAVMLITSRARRLERTFRARHSSRMTVC